MQGWCVAGSDHRFNEEDLNLMVQKVCVQHSCCQYSKSGYQYVPCLGTSRWCEMEGADLVSSAATSPLHSIND